MIPGLDIFPRPDPRPAPCALADEPHKNPALRTLGPASLGAMGSDAPAPGDTGWLTAERARAARLVLLIILPAIALIWLGLSRGGVDPAGNPIGTDYLSFWTAARLALAGQSAAPYDVAIHYAAQRAAFQADLGYAAFFYPPPFLLVLLPFGILPYFGSL